MWCAGRVTADSTAKMQRPWFAWGLVMIAFVAAFLALLAPSTVAQSLIGTVKVGDNPGATVADPIRNLIYVICEYDDTIYVINGSSNAVVRSFPLPYNISGMALDPVANRLYVASCRPIHVLDAATGIEVGTISECVFHPEELAIDAGRHRLLVSDESGVIGVSDYVNVYDTMTLQRVARVEIGYSSAFRSVAVAVNTATGMGYASYDAQPNLVLFDVMTGEIKAQIRDIGAWHGVVVDPVLNRVYVRCLSDIAVFDGTTAARLGSLPVAGLIGVNPGGRRVYSWKNRDLQIFDANTLAKVGTVPAIGYAGYYASIGVLEALGRVYCPMTYDDKMAVIQDVAAVATPTQSAATPTPSPTPTQTATPGSSSTPTCTRTLGPARVFLPIVRK